MCAQIKVRLKNVSNAAAAKHLTNKQRKQLKKRGEITIDLPGDRIRQQKIRLALNARYVS